MATATDLRTFGKTFCGSVLVLALVLVSGATPTWGQQSGGPLVAPVEQPQIDQTLPGARRGILTNTTKGTVQIGRDTFILAPDAILEDDKGQSLTWKDLSIFNGLDQGVLYWLGTDAAGNRIVQMIVQPPQ